MKRPAILQRAIAWFPEVSKADLALVGGKGASLGEMARSGIPVPPGFTITSEAYYSFLHDNKLGERIQAFLQNLDSNDTQALDEVSKRIKRAITSIPVAASLAQGIRGAYRKLGGGLVAVRSSATAEDLPESSFAGQQSTFLNISGEEALIQAVRKCWASLFESRALFYRAERGFDHLKVGIAVVVQRMVQSETAGVLFTVEPLTSDGTKMAIEAVYGLGEAIVSGAVTPDLYIVEKGTLQIQERKISRQEWKLILNPELVVDLEDANIQVDVPAGDREKQKLSDETITALAQLGRQIEGHYGHPQDIEWAIEGGQIYIVQSRPVTTLRGLPDEIKKLQAKVLLTGSGACPGIESGPVKVVHGMSELVKVEKGDVLVTEMTTPDFVPAMKRAAAIVTDKGGRTCHAAIVSRELGIPCVVGAGAATTTLPEGAWVTVDGAQGYVYEGRLELIRKPTVVHSRIRTATRVYVNLADPELADVIAQRHVDGVGLLRAEFIVAHIGDHPRYMLESERGQEWTDNLADGMEKFAKAFSPRPVVYRTTDFKTNEYRNLRGGERYEEQEENPMIGYRGASRYIQERDLFHLEAEAIRKVREGYDNLYVMIPFVRTPEQLKAVKQLLEEEGLRREDGLKLWLMVEIPSNVILLDQFLDVGIDGISIGSNDLTQLVLGIDRDNARLGASFDERHPAVLRCLEQAITGAARRGVTSSICGQAPSFFPDLTEKLVGWGITSVSVSPDMIDQTRQIVARVEKKQGKLPHQDGEE
ncbi:MAG: phosphoenolpyruvate synthase [Chloroflexi bacterium]|nr:phosphoenolpyruvate synthase [Chloroflexota bacterium]